MFRLLVSQAAAVGIVVASIALDGTLRPSPGVELGCQLGALIAALVVSWRGLARFAPDLDRRWRARQRKPWATNTDIAEGEGV